MSTWWGGNVFEALVLSPCVSVQPFSMSFNSILKQNMKGISCSPYPRCCHAEHRGGRIGRGTTCKVATNDQIVGHMSENHQTSAGGSIVLESSSHEQYQAREQLATIVDYQPEAFERYFAGRPEQLWGRFAQIAVELWEVLFALVTDRFTQQDTTPRRIRESATRLGPNFVKIGQALASRPDLVGDAIAGELLLLQDAMPIFPTEIARECIREVRSQGVASCSEEDTSRSASESESDLSVLVSGDFPGRALGTVDISLIEVIRSFGLYIPR